MTKIENIYHHNIGARMNRVIIRCWRHGALNCVPETAMLERVAAELGLDPTEVALKNDGEYGKTREEVNVIAAEQGFVVRDSLRECLEPAKEAMDWDNKWHAPGTKILPNGKYHGLGMMTSYMWQPEVPDYASIGMSVQFGGAILYGGNEFDDIGVNIATNFCRVAADEAGFKYEDVSYSAYNDSPYKTGRASNSSGHLDTLPVVIKAARQIKRQLLEIAANGHEGRPPLFTDKTPEELDIKDSVVFEKTNPDNKFTVNEVCDSKGQGSTQVPLVAVGWTRGDLLSRGGPPETDMWIDIPMVKPELYLPRAVHMCEVEVDPETGLVDIVKQVHACDGGKIIGPESYEGQLDAGSHFGLGRSNVEGLFYDPQTGVKLNDNHIGYPIYNIGDLKSPINIPVETGQGYGAYGFAACSEHPVATNSWLTPAAVYNAIGKWVDPPTTPDKILKALGKA
jgi:xanthine dehydrogenase molybdenum-binding subunit